MPGQKNIVPFVFVQFNYWIGRMLEIGVAPLPRVLFRIYFLFGEQAYKY